MSTRISRFVRDLRRHTRQTQTEFGDEISASQSTISRWEKAEDTPDVANLERLVALAKEKGFDYRPYMSKNGAFTSEEVPLAGYIGAGAEIHPFPDQDPVEYLEPPPGASSKSEAVKVRGTSMLPAYRDGTILFYDRLLAPEEMLGKECVVHLTDGRKFIKIISRGSGPHLYNLISLNADPITDVTVDAVSPIVWIKPTY